MAEDEPTSFTLFRTSPSVKCSHKRVPGNRIKNLRVTLDLLDLALLILDHSHASMCTSWMEGQGPTSASAETANTLGSNEQLSGFLATLSANYKKTE